MDGTERNHTIHGSSDRAFGVTVGAILVAIGGFRWYVAGASLLVVTLFTVGTALMLCGVIAPRVLAPLNRAWMKLGLLLGRIVSPVALGLIYVVSVVPTGIAMRLMRRDILRLKFDRQARSYWISRPPGRPSSEAFTDQF